MNEGNRDGLQSLHQVTDESTDQTGKDLKSTSFSVQRWVCLLQHIQKASLSLYIDTYMMFLFEIHSYIALLTYRPSAARERWWIHINVHPGKQAHPQGSSMIHF